MDSAMNGQMIMEVDQQNETSTTSKWQFLNQSPQSRSLDDEKMNVGGNTFGFTSLD